MMWLPLEIITLFTSTVDTYEKFQCSRVIRDYVTFVCVYVYDAVAISDHLGKEIITQFTSTVDTNKTWYTDANGREMQKRM